MQFHKLVALLVFSFVVILGVSGGETQAQGIVWTSQFYNNTTLSGSPVATRQDSSLLFNWGTGSPAGGVNADNFSAVFTTVASFANTSYRFQIVADDGVRLTVDSAVLINTFDNPQPSKTLTADFTLSAGQHTVRVDYREFSGDAFLYVGWVPTTSAPNPSNPTAVPAQPVTGGSWRAQYYGNRDLSGSPARSQDESSPTHYWGSNSPAANLPPDDFSVRWTGTLTLNGKYNIAVKADDGVRVYVDGTLHIDEWHGARNETYAFDFTVSNGTHTIVVEYYERSGDAFIDFNLRQAGTGTGTVPTPIVNPGNPTGSGSWLAQYYNNNSLSGSPVVSQYEVSITRNWGGGSPSSLVPVDNFSARWTSSQYLNGGTYQIAVRADDGVRVYIDGARYIDQWHPSTGANTYTANANLATGTHTITVEYYDALELAFIEFNLTQVGNAPVVYPTYVYPTPIPPVLNNNPQATVLSARLNVRSAPTTSATILTQIVRGTTVAIVGRNADSSWWQVNVNGTIGWISATYASASNTQNVGVTVSNPVPSNPVPVPSNPTNTGFVGVTTGNLNFRSAPSTSAQVLTVIPRNTSVGIMGKDTTGAWWMVNYRGAVGWVSARYVFLQSTVVLSSIPVAS